MENRTKFWLICLAALVVFVGTSIATVMAIDTHSPPNRYNPANTDKPSIKTPDKSGSGSTETASSEQKSGGCATALGYDESTGQYYKRDLIVPWVIRYNGSPLIIPGDKCYIWNPLTREIIPEDNIQLMSKIDQTPLDARWVNPVFAKKYKIW